MYAHIWHFKEETVDPGLTWGFVKLVIVLEFCHHIDIYATITVPRWYWIRTNGK